jgi:glutaredoxin
MLVACSSWRYYLFVYMSDKDRIMKTAKLYRMDMPGHTCPHGLKAKDLLQQEGFEFEDHSLKTREEVDAFKEKHNVKTTPQVWIGDEHIGGHDDLRAHLGKEVSSQDGETYQPVMVIFGMALLMAIAMSYAFSGHFMPLRIFEWFIAVSVCFLAVQKLQDIDRFATMFLNYDLLAKRWLPYAKIYPFAEALAGILMLSGAVVWIASPLMLFIGTIGAYSVYKAVYVEKRALKCACVGGDSRVPLGFVSLTENLMMVFMGFWMLF